MTVLVSERLKTSSEKVREASLLQELLDTVSQRNLIVDSIEEDRIRCGPSHTIVRQIPALANQSVPGCPFCLTTEGAG